ncbi:hypothetical protein CLV24_108146 [Pontibacter ummariensis]|uniref:Uncharacterized protein n=1 Tax=Pontibacter ummariensis TaxID=1610492 RepID=A0A239F6V5_9BACT|nr:hypothetical protein CLV24_108146 [Pontibacter ummariensis]SNS52527.1 hypothetical protein SAMN06296052_10839 [Pontibacter ummariensis]
MKRPYSVKGVGKTLFENTLPYWKATSSCTKMAPSLSDFPKSSFDSPVRGARKSKGR